MKSREFVHRKVTIEGAPQSAIRHISNDINRPVKEVTSPPGERDQCTSKAHSKGNPIPVSTNTSNAMQELLELEATKKHEEEQLVSMRKLEKELAIAELEEENARDKRTQGMKKWK